MRMILCFFLVLPLCGQSSAESDAIAVLQKLFDALAAHDGESIRGLMLPDARVSVVRESGAPTGSSAAEMAERIGRDKTVLKERFTSAPKVLVRGRLAQVWGEYEFQRDGKFSHCGVDVATLVRTETGWKIASLGYTVETTGCGGR